MLKLQAHSVNFQNIRCIGKIVVHSPIMKDSEAHEILQNLEDDFRHDLSLHLYSAFLLHLENPSFPPKRWTAWPLPYDKVPDPKTSALYIDEQNPFGQKPSSRKKNPEPEPLDEVKRLPHWEYEIWEEITDPNENLKIELHAVFEKLLRSQTLTELPVEPPVSLTPEALNRTMAKIDHLIDELVIARINKRITTQSSKRTFDTDAPRLASWQDVVSASANEKAWQRCSKLFPDSNSSDERAQERNKHNSASETLHRKQVEINDLKRKLSQNLDESDYIHRFRKSPR